MKTIICLALCLIAVSALSPVDNLYSALDIVDMHHLLDGHKAFDLSVAFTYIGGVKSDDNKVDEKIWIQGTYNLLTYEDGKGKLKSDQFNKTKTFTSKHVVNFTGGGGFQVRGGGSKDKEAGYFNGDSSTDFAFKTDGGLAFGLREHHYAGHFADKKNWGKANIEVNVWQHGNSSHNSIDYKFGGDKKESRYSGSSKGYGETTLPNKEEYKSFFKSVFHGVNAKDTWQVSGGYVIDVVDSDWNNVYSKDGAFNKNGTCDDALGTFTNVKTFGLPSSHFITE